MTKNVLRAETRAVLAGAYKGKAASRLTHTAIILQNGKIASVLCRRVDAESLADAAADDVNAPPTCERCRAADRRFEAGE